MIIVGLLIMMIKLIQIMIVQLRLTLLILNVEIFVVLKILVMIVMIVIHMLRSGMEKRIMIILFMDLLEDIMRVQLIYTLMYVSVLEGDQQG